MSFAQIGKKYGISRQAVRKRVIRLRGQATVANCARGAKDLLDNRIDVMGDLAYIRSKAMALLHQAEAAEDSEVMLRSISELRMQLRLAGDLMCQVTDVRAVAEFQQIVLKTISEESPDVQKRIVKRLNHARAIQSAVNWGIATTRSSDRHRR